MTAPTTAGRVGAEVKPTPHDAAGVNAKALSTIMGHATIAITFDVYGHLMPGGLDEAARATNAYLHAPPVSGRRSGRWDDLSSGSA